MIKGVFSQMELKLQKVHGSENDFFLLDETELPRTLTALEIDQLSKKLCDRQTGLLAGADGILLVGTVDKGTSLGKMRVINSDSSEASMCGNGLRTVARYLAEKYGEEKFTVETMFADLQVRKSAAIGPEIETYQVEISPVSFDVETLPMNYAEGTLIDEIIPELSETLRFSAVAVPNPHLITFVDHETLISDEFERIAYQVNHGSELFPDGVNVSFVEVLGPNKIFVRTYERGVGFTSACGTAMCASSLMYCLLKDGQFFETIDVLNAGGMVRTVVHERAEGGYWMELIGNATVTNLVTGDLEDLLSNDFSKLTITDTDEQAKYISFLQEMRS